MLLRFILRLVHCVADLLCGIAYYLNLRRHLTLVRTPTESKEWHGSSLAEWISNMKRIAKMPKHIGIIVAEEPISYADISHIVIWCVAMGITYISIYDHNGTVKKNKEIFHKQLTTVKQKILGKSRKQYRVKLDTLHLNGVANGYTDAEDVVINLFSHLDGRPKLAKAARDICISVTQGLVAPAEIGTDFLEDYLSLHNMPDPDLIVQFGFGKSTIGFLPWHIRLSEILSLPSHNNIRFEDFCDVISRFSLCEQRFGK